MKVVLPAPEGPMIAATLLGRNSPVTPQLETMVAPSDPHRNVDWSRHWGTSVPTLRETIFGGRMDDLDPCPSGST